MEPLKSWTAATYASWDSRRSFCKCECSRWVQRSRCDFLFDGVDIDDGAVWLTALWYLSRALAVAYLILTVAKNAAKDIT